MSTRGSKRGPWGRSEDEELLRLVAENGAHNWVQIADLLGSRSPKQCRERYHQNLKPTLNHEPITPEEGEIIERLVNEMGKRWAEIARRLVGRSDNAVKNWWNGGMNRRRRIVVRRRDADQGGAEFDENVEQPSFARPAPLPHYHRQILVPTPQRRIEQPLTSPANSEMSMPDSLGEAPSLVSDSSTHRSLASPSYVTPSYPQYLPFPEAPSSESWRQLHTSQVSPGYSNSMPTGLDPSTPSWPQSGISKSPYIPAPQNQRLEQFAEVATRTRPMTGYVTQRQHQSFTELPTGSLGGNSRQQQSFADLPTRASPLMNHGQRQYQHFADFPDRAPPAASSVTHGQHQQFAEYPTRPSPSANPLARHQHASLQDQYSLPPIRHLLPQTADHTRFPLLPTAPSVPTPTRPADRPQQSASTVRSPAVRSVAPPTEHSQQPSSSRKRTADDADLMEPSSSRKRPADEDGLKPASPSSLKKTADDDDLTTSSSKRMDLSNVLD